MLQRELVQLGGDPRTTESVSRLQAELSALQRSLEESQHSSTPTESAEMVQLREALSHERQAAEASQRRGQQEQATLARLRHDAEATARDLQQRTHETRIDEERQRKGLDLCIMMDCTGSMASWIAICAQKVLDIIDAVRRIDPSCAMTRIAFLGYRDYMDARRFETIDFVEPAAIPELRSHITALRAEGGGDTPEDIAAAFARVSELSWRQSTKVIIHVADAPCHGRRYHDCDDSKPDGDPDHDPETLIAGFARRRIDYYFMRIHARTDKMTDIFRQVYERYQGPRFGVLNTGDDPSRFLPVVIESLTRSLRV